MSLTLPGDVRVDPPVVPTVRVEPPSPATVVTVPQRGPKGQKGDKGDAGEPEDLGHEYIATVSALLHQIHHSLPFKPAGVTVNDLDGDPILGFHVVHPAPGITEVSFGAAVRPTILLS